MLHDTDGCGMMTVQCHSVQQDEIKPDKWTQIFHLFLDLSGSGLYQRDGLVPLIV